jgi:hypothetical protein
MKMPPFELVVVVPFQLHSASNVRDAWAATLLRQLESSFKRGFAVVHFSSFGRTYCAGELAGGVGSCCPDVPLVPLLAPDDAGISPGGCEFMGIVGEMGETWALFSLPDPTAPGVTPAAGDPAFGYSGVTRPVPGACADATVAVNREPSALTKISIFIINLR